MYRRLFLERLQAVFDNKELVLCGKLARFVEPAAFARQRNRLLATGRFLTMVPGYSLIPQQYPFLRALPVEMPASRAPVTVVTVRNRTLSPLAVLFLETLREIATRAMTKGKSKSSSA